MVENVTLAIGIEEFRKSFSRCHLYPDRGPLGAAPLIKYSGCYSSKKPAPRQAPHDAGNQETKALTPGDRKTRKQETKALTQSRKAAKAQRRKGAKNG
jgi:hypothetical protein